MARGVAALIFCCLAATTTSVVSAPRVAELAATGVASQPGDADAAAATVDESADLADEPAADDGGDDVALDDVAAAADEPVAPTLARRPPWTHAHVVDALAGESALLWRIAWCEVGRSGTFNPYAIGGQGERGILQLLPGRGNGLSIFYGAGYSEPEDPYQNVEFFHDVAAGRLRGVTIANQWPRTSRGCPGVPY